MKKILTIDEYEALSTSDKKSYIPQYKKWKEIETDEPCDCCEDCMGTVTLIERIPVGKPFRYIRALLGDLIPNVWKI